MKETNLMRPKAPKSSAGMQASCHAIEYMCYQAQHSDHVQALYACFLRSIVPGTRNGVVLVPY
jgi:hypothetical protein